MESEMLSSGAQPAFEEPSSDHFLYVAWGEDPPTRIPIVRRSDKRRRLIERCRTFAATTESSEGVVAATVYEVELMPPLPDIPRYDVLMLIRARLRTALLPIELRLRHLEPDFMMAARNKRRIGDTGRKRSASFLFNHFVADRPAVAMEGFDRVAGWFPDKLGVDNTTLLEPVDQAISPYAFMNYVRVPRGSRSFLLGMLTKPSFYTEVRRTLRAYDMTALPLLAKQV